MSECVSLVCMHVCLVCMHLCVQFFFSFLSVCVGVCVCVYALVVIMCT